MFFSFISGVRVKLPLMVAPKNVKEGTYSSGLPRSRR